jgi:uncharacterized membrane protein YqjE
MVLTEKIINKSVRFISYYCFFLALQLLVPFLFHLLDNSFSHSANIIYSGLFVWTGVNLLKKNPKARVAAIILISLNIASHLSIFVEHLIDDGMRVSGFLNIIYIYAQAICVWLLFQKQTKNLFTELSAVKTSHSNSILDEKKEASQIVSQEDLSSINEIRPSNIKPPEKVDVFSTAILITALLALFTILGLVSLFFTILFFGAG